MNLLPARCERREEIHWRYIFKKGLGYVVSSSSLLTSISIVSSP